jgi:histidine triad (HIT) family protein
MAASCPFCAYVVGEFPRELIVYEDEDVIVIPCKSQKRSNRGHCLVVTRAHISNIYELPRELSAPILRTVSAAARASKRAFSADGIAVRQNNEAAGGQDVFHLHFHIVPRFSGDNFDATPYEQVDEDTRINQAKTLRAAWEP